MKNLYGIWFLVLLTACNTSEENSDVFEVDWPASPFYWDYTLLKPAPRADLVGPVKSVHERIYGAKMDGNQLIKTPEIRIGRDGENNTIKFFDPKGKIIFEDVYYYQYSPETSSRKRFAYYDDGKLIHMNFTVSDYFYTEFYLYDEKRRLEQVVVIHSGSEKNSPDLTTYENYVYNDSLNSITVENIAEQRILRHTTFWLDEYGNISRVETYFVDQNQRHSSTIKYNKSGKIIEVVVAEANNRMSYDDHGFLVKLTSGPGDKEISEFRYELDDQCNWIRRVEYVKGHPLQITEREIEYY